MGGEYVWKMEPEWIPDDESENVGRTALEVLASELGMPVEHLREAAIAMQEKKIREASSDLHAAFFAMCHDWNDGDFNLPPLARIHMEEMERKAIELGKLLFRKNAKSAVTAAHEGKTI